MLPEIPGFELAKFTHGGKAHAVYRGGSGPAVIVIHELPGIGERFIEFGRKLIDAGYTVYMPSLFGQPEAAGGSNSMFRTMARICVAREFTLLANKTSPVVTWLRALAAKAYAECGGPGVGAIGMCFTGGFALAMAVEPAVLAPVMSQPVLPAPLTDGRRALLGLGADDLATVKERTRTGLCVLGLRFTNDKGSPAARFETLRRELGESFEGIEIDSSPGNPHGISEGAHCVLTLDLVDEPGHPTREARERVIAFLNEHLQPGST